MYDRCFCVRRARKQDSYTYYTYVDVPLLELCFVLFFIAEVNSICSVCMGEGVCVSVCVWSKRRTHDEDIPGLGGAAESRGCVEVVDRPFKKRRDREHAAA